MAEECYERPALREITFDDNNISVCLKKCLYEK